MAYGSWLPTVEIGYLFTGYLVPLLRVEIRIRALFFVSQRKNGLKFPFSSFVQNGLYGCVRLKISVKYGYCKLARISKSQSKSPKTEYAAF